MKRGEKLFELIVLGTPRPKSRPRFVKGRVVSTTGTHESLWKSHLQSEIRKVRPLKPYDGALMVDASFYFEAKDSDRLGEPHTFKPDKDNLEKLCLDVLKGDKVITDDCRVAGGEVTKEWQMRGGVVIAVFRALAEAVS